MSRHSNPITHLLAATTFLGIVALSSSTYAASTSDAAAPATMPTTTGSPAKLAPVDHVEKRINDLHSKLHITAAQEAQWGTVAQAMRDNAQNMDTLIKDRAAHAKTMTAVEDLTSYEKLAAAHEDGLKSFIPVFQALYDSMSDNQKKSADAAFRSNGAHEKHAKS